MLGLDHLLTHSLTYLLTRLGEVLGLDHARTLPLQLTHPQGQLGEVLGLDHARTLPLQLTHPQWQLAQPGAVGKAELSEIRELDGDPLLEMSQRHTPVEDERLELTD